MPSSSGIETDTIIIGNGPSALLLSYILHGYIPRYIQDPPHPDPLLHAKLKDSPQLLSCDIDRLTEHFAASRISYSTQALPINVLFDTLVRPNAEVDDTEKDTNVEWCYMPEKAVPHLIFGNTPCPGGQWTDNPVAASWDIQTLSYAGMLGLPGYSFAEHYRKSTGKELPAFTRPTRKEVADYFAAYPVAVGIEGVIRCGETLENISRTADGFYIGSHGIRCKRLVLASGIFSEVISPPSLLQPLASLPLGSSARQDAPLLVIGSGFSAADVIISAPKDRKIIHVFKWDPDNRPSPLRACHQQAYPEYAGVYRLMKRAALTLECQSSDRPKNRRLASTSFLESRPWDEVYEGCPNTEITHVEVSEGRAIVSFRRSDGTTVTREVCGLAYAAGRKGSLRYLDNALLTEVLDGEGVTDTDGSVTGQTLRSKAMDNLEVAPDVFIIGSLTGDSLIRFAHGGCVYAASRIIPSHNGLDERASVRSSSSTSTQKTPRIVPAAMNGMDGHHTPRSFLDEKQPQDRREKDEDERLKHGTAQAEKPRASSWWTSLLQMLR
ncbi:hypothetical protein DTO164E3_7905 [Paecilomyces variotii]|nr:hypothetical protein DTO164E3_7905 [Paecilomyces variotii]KAJ9194853.1 hypothetical protein DTO032I3_7183 [Paecilomyces variotii]KAJ9244744.1 hypothetical protein DTO169E5_1565 [Paecilomyces variotii]KAJ9246759.1 hypothetical protein DTO195F2_9267 [Paecilomyces variotii]KAJ9250001.1 hypothetical protein DTO207G8_6314 [Paecilomyces variotii]